MIRRIYAVFLLIFSVTFLPVIASGDKVIRNNGQTLEGKIVFEDQIYIKIDIGGSVFEISKDEIKQIIRADEKETSLDKARNALANNNTKASIDFAISALSENPDNAAAKEIITKSYYIIRDNAIKASTTTKTPEKDIEDIKAVIAMLSNETIAKSFPSSDEVQKEIRGLNTLIGELYYTKAKILSEQNNSSNDNMIISDLKSSIQSAPEDSPIYYKSLFTLARYYEKLNQIPDAKAAMEQAYQKAANPNDKSTAKAYLDKLNGVKSAPAVNTAAAPQQPVQPQIPRPAVPTPRSIRQEPTPVIVIPQTPTPTPPPTPTPTMEQNVKEAVKTKNLLAFFNTAPAKIKKVLQKDGVLEWIIIIAAILVFNWILPIKIAKMRMNKGDSVAAQYYVWILRLGLIPLIAFLVVTFMNRSSRKRCPYCNKLIDNIDSYADMNFFICPHCNENISPIYDLKDYVEHLIRSVQMELTKDKKKATDSVVEKDAMVKLVRAILTMAYRKRASDVHIEQEMEGVKIRVRIDGILYDLIVLPRALSNAIISAIKVMANLDIAEKRIPQDGRIQVWLDKSELDIRLNTSPIPLGEKASMRLLDCRSIEVDALKLGFEGDNLATFDRSIKKPHGVILVTGPTGSGKSTTLYVAIKALNNGEKNIVTIEDPIEYAIKGVNQMQINEAQNFTFATGLRSILRQDPDIIMVGEIRDKETAEICIDAAMTGHLVLSTLHTIDAPTAFSRLNDLGLPPRRYAPALENIIAQRLVRVNCNDCKKPYKPKKQDLEELNLLNIDKDTIFIKGTGCEMCDHIGFHGRVGIYEILIPDEEMKELLESNATTSAIRELAKNKGMKTLREQGIVKVLRGLTTIDEVIRVTS